jgi:triosephosphate isomerase
MAQPRQRIVGVSLKLYFSVERTAEYIRDISGLGPIALSHNVETFIIPDFLTLMAASATLRLEAPTIRLGAQDCFWEDEGAYTGEVSPKALASIGCSIVELGHAERRRLFGETDEQVAKKASAAVRNGLTPLVCIGEKNQGRVEQAVEECRPQIEAVLQAVGREQEIIWAYEPVWAIGQAEPASPEYVVAVTKALREIFGDGHRILYGGSAKPGTFEKIKDGVDGLFLGRFGHSKANVEAVIAEVGGSY